MKIKVTEEHIKNGVRKSCDLCPVALAINNCLKTDYTAHITLEHIYIFKRPYKPKNIYETYFLAPFVVANFVVKFDKVFSDFTPEPFSFELDIPQKFLKNEPHGS